jgi:hypothetical protein
VIRAFLNQRTLLEWGVLTFAFSLPLTIAVAEPLVFLLILGAGIQGMQSRGEGPRMRWHPFLWPVAAFVLIAGATALWSVRPELSLSRMHRLLIPGMIFIVAAIYGRGAASPFRVMEPAVFFLAGCTLLSLHDIVHIPRAALAGASLESQGNMRDPQMYLVSMAVLLALLPVPRLRLWRPLIAAALALQGLGMILHFKRGVWLAFLLVSVCHGGISRRWKPLLAVAILAAASLLYPAVRTRVTALPSLWADEAGGRYALWTDVAPALLPRYPQGMGWCAVNHDDLSAHTGYVQAKLNHLHNNILQVALETGWLGLAAWGCWMGVALGVMVRNVRQIRDPVPGALALGILCAFIGLLVNGMVEYNFGDTELLMLFCFLMGIAQAQGVRVPP